MQTTITKRYTFEAAHWLPHVPEDHKCHRIHGHNYEVEVTITAERVVDGMVMDFWDLDDIVHPMVHLVDHRVLNDVNFALRNPTAELIAVWFLQGVKKGLTDSLITHVSCTNVVVYETKDCWACVAV